MKCIFSSLQALTAAVITVACACVACACVACGGGEKRGADSVESSDSLSGQQIADLTEEAWQWADSSMRSMTLQKRIGQLFMPAVYTTADAATMEQIADYAERLGVGGVVLLKGDMVSAGLIADSLAEIAPYGLFVAVDAETGLSMRFEDAPDFMWNSEISPKADESALYDYGQEVARECRLAGINMVLGPVLDVAGGEKRRRSFGGDAGRVGRLGTAYARGLEDGGVMSVAKHFPGHGSSKGDSHQRLSVATKSREEMMSTDLQPFQAYCDAGLSCVMVGHIYAEGLDSVRRPAAFSPAIIKNLLKKKFHFSGLVLTDALNMQGASGYGAADAISAGADIVMAPLHTEREMTRLRDAVEAGRIAEREINDRCRRVLFFKYVRGIAGPHTARERFSGSPEILRHHLSSEAAKVKHSLTR